MPLLFKTGYYERVIQLNHAEKYHGQKASWKKYIDNLKKQIDVEAKTAQLTADEIANPKRKIGRWPTPGAMLDRLRRDGTASQDTLDYLEYMKDWLYRELSGQTHLNVSGITMRGVFLSDEGAKRVFEGQDWEEKREQKLEEYRQKQVWLSIILMLAIVSEIEGHFHLGRNQKAREVWTILNHHSDIALDLWDTRYSHLLPNLTPPIESHQNGSHDRPSTSTLVSLRTDERARLITLQLKTSLYANIQVFFANSHRIEHKALEPAQIRVISFDDLQRFYREVVLGERFGRLIAEESSLIRLSNLPLFKRVASAVGEGLLPSRLSIRFLLNKLKSV